MRILILADDCNPKWPSLPVVGYNTARAVAELADTVVVTHIRNRENIEKAGLGRAAVRFVDNEYVARPMYKLSKLLRGGVQTGWTAAIALNYPSYLAFEWEVWKAFRNELRRGDFDLVHRITPMSPTLPSPFASWSPVPFVVGPLNGALRWPPQFHSELAREREWLTYLRGAYRIFPYARSTYTKSAAILAGFEHTIRDLPAAVKTRVFNFPEVGFDPTIFNKDSERPVSDKKSILFVGRLVPYKLPDLLVRVFADRPALRKHKLIMVGDGPDRVYIENVVRKCGLQDQVQLLGWKSQVEVAALMQSADVFAFPSIRELGAGVLVEAMACRLACIVVDYGAPGTLIAAGRGIKLPLGTKEQLTVSFGDALEKIVADDGAARAMGDAAHEHVMQLYSWENKARKLVAIYEWVLGRRDRPDFWRIEGEPAGAI